MQNPTKNFKIILIPGSITSKAELLEFLQQLLQQPESNSDGIQFIKTTHFKLERMPPFGRKIFFFLCFLTSAKPSFLFFFKSFVMVMLNKTDNENNLAHQDMSLIMF